MQSNNLNTIVMKASDFAKNSRSTITLVISYEAQDILNRVSNEQKVSKSYVVDQLIKTITFD